MAKRKPANTLEGWMQIIEASFVRLDDLLEQAGILTEDEIRADIKARLARGERIDQDTIDNFFPQGLNGLN